MRWLIRKYYEPNIYKLIMKSTDFETVTDSDKTILAFFLYLELTGQIIIKGDIVGKPFPVDEEIQKALGILAKNF